MEDKAPRRLIRELAKEQTLVAVSILTPWEIALKPELGFRPAQVEDAIEKIGASLLPINLTHIAKFAALPSVREHRDPFDRMLIAQALSDGHTLASRDQRFELYPGLNVIWD